MMQGKRRFENRLVDKYLKVKFNLAIGGAVTAGNRGCHMDVNATPS